MGAWISGSLAGPLLRGFGAEVRHSVVCAGILSDYTYSKGCYAGCFVLEMAKRPQFLEMTYPATIIDGICRNKMSQKDLQRIREV